MTRKIKTDQQYVRALIKPNSFDKEKRTFEVTFATETPVRMYNWDIGEFDEILDCNSKSVRMERAKNGLPVFDSHFPRTAMVQLGRADNIQFKNSEGSAIITLGARADEAFISDLENGIIQGISVGYRVYMYDGKIEKDKTPQLRATDWEPLEISFAPVQADPKSRIRSEASESSINTIINFFNSDMKKTIAEIRAIATDEQKVRLDAIIAMTRAANLSDEKVVELFESEKTVEQIRSEYTKPNEPNKPVNVEEIRQQADAATKARLDSILKSTRAAKLEDSFAIELFNSDKTIEECRQAVIEKFAKGDPQVDGNNSINVGKEAIEKKREAAEQAILNRIAPKAFDLKVDGAREMRNLSIHEMACTLAAERTGKIVIIGKREMADMIFGSSRAQSTSDFPLLLENVMYKALRADYKFAPEFWTMIARETSVEDFREKSLYQVDSVNGMQEIAEGGEIKYTKLVEGKQKIRVKKYAEGIKFTREAYINDDLSAFSLIPSRFVLDWETIKGDIVWGLLINNPKMDDGKEFFEKTNHKNLLDGTGSALTDAGLEAADLAMTSQKGLDGKKILRITPRFLIVPNALKITAKKLMTAITATKTGDVNVFNGAYDTIVEPRLTDTSAWYLAADPASVEGIYYAYLNGEAGLRSNRVEDFDSDSIKFAVRGEFGAQVIDHRGWVKNAGK